MAYVEAPLMSLAASGTIGAVNYSRRHNRGIARNAYHPVQPGSSAQLVYQGRLGALATAWNSLTAAQREVWEDVARSITKHDPLMREYQSSGRHLYISWNMSRQLIGLSTNAAPQARQLVMHTGFTAITGGSGSVVLYAVPFSATATTWRVAYYQAGAFNSEARRALPSEYRFVDYKASNSSLTISGLTVGKYYWFKAVPIERCGFQHNLLFAQFKVV